MTGGVHGKGHVWWGVCMAGGMCGRGHAWQGVCMPWGVHGRGHAWQERQPLQRTVHILLECILVGGLKPILDLGFKARRAFHSLQAYILWCI